MATLGTLGQMMMNLPPKIDQYDPLEVLRQQNVAQGGQIANQTALITLEDLKRQQETAARTRQYYQQNPGAALLGNPALGTSPQGVPGAPGGMPGGPMTQQQVVPGQAPGVPQQVPGGMDLSQFATGGAPGGGMPGAPPQAPMGGPQRQANPLEALMRTDPDAAFQVMGQQFKLQEQRLNWGEKIAGSIGRIAQGVNDQASLDQARDDIRQIDPRAAAQLPQFYSKDAMTPFIERALSVKDKIVLQTDAVKAQADLLKARMSGRVATTDQYLKALGVAPGQETPQDMEKALAWQQKDEIARQAAHGQGQLKDTALGVARIGKTGEVEYVRAPTGEILQPKPSDTMEKIATLGNLADSANKTASALEDKGLRPGVWEKGMDKLPLGIGNYLVSSDYQKYRQAVSEFAQAWLYKTSGAQVTVEEWNRTNETYFPQPGEDKAAVEQKRQKRAALIDQLRDEAKATGRTAGQGQPQSQPPAASSGQGPATFDPADFSRWRTGAGKTGNPTAPELEAYFESKGLKKR